MAHLSSRGIKRGLRAGLGAAQDGGRCRWNFYGLPQFKHDAAFHCFTIKFLGLWRLDIIICHWPLACIWNARGSAACFAMDDPVWPLLPPPSPVFTPLLINVELPAARFHWSSDWLSIRCTLDTSSTFRALSEQFQSTFRALSGQEQHWNQSLVGCWWQTIAICQQLRKVNTWKDNTLK